MDNKRIGELIKKKRKEMHWTQAQLAEQLHVSTNAVSKWELGKNAINMEYLKDISKLLNIPMSMLADVPPEAPESDGLPSSPGACLKITSLWSFSHSDVQIWLLFWKKWLVPRFFHKYSRLAYN